MQAQHNPQGNHKLMELPGHTIQGEISRGGMSIVYLAIQESLNREVALKVVSPTLAADEGFTECFLKEGEIIAKLSHPNIITVYDISVWQGCHYLSVEYCSGGTLKQQIEQGIPLRRAIQILKKIGSAIAYSHRLNIIHRDIKPRNILFRHDGSPVLADFGIAELHTGINDSGPGTSALMVGSPGYMSPEYVRGETIDKRSDLYSLGVLIL